MTQEWDADKGRGGFSLRFLTDSLGTNTVKDIRSNLRSLDDNSNFFGLKEKQSLIPVTIIFPKVKKKCALQSLNWISVMEPGGEVWNCAPL